jgi:purine-binding chemotaxis protein CheW
MQSPTPASSAAGARASAASPLAKREFLSFKLGAEEYGIDILKVQEIRGYEKPTRMANVPAYILGVVNLRGIIVPIIDLRIKFKLESAGYDEFTVVIIVNLSGRVLGFVVDGVSDVISLGGEQIKPKPEFSATIDTDHIVGLGTIDQRMLILVDIERLTAGSELAASAPAPALQ